MRRGSALVLGVALSLAGGARAEYIFAPTYGTVLTIRSAVDHELESARREDRREKRQATQNAKSNRQEREELERQRPEVDVYRGQATGIGRPAPRKRAEREGTREEDACSDDAGCDGWCVGGRCTNTRPETPRTELADNCANDQDCGERRVCSAFRCVEVEVTLGAACDDDAACGDGRACQQGRCASREPVVPASQLKCSTTAACGTGQTCTEGQCVTVPPSPPSSLWPGTELFLRGHTTDLRQELALGEGPVISTLARVLRVDALQLGRSMRAHRRGLVALVGEAGDVTWPARFLEQAQVCFDSTAG